MQDKPKLLDQVREKLRVKQYSIRTEQAYVDWIKRFVLFHRKRHPETMGNREVSEFISHLATHRNVAASTQNQALSALVFLYQQVLGRELGWLDDLERAKRPARLPVVLTQAEVRSVLAHLDGRHELMAKLLYGTGLRLMECVRLRVKDADFLFTYAPLLGLEFPLTAALLSTVAAAPQALHFVFSGHLSPLLQRK